jgi:hypothetical protein
MFFSMTLYSGLVTVRAVFMLLKIRSFNVSSFVKLLFYMPPLALEQPAEY